LITYEFDRVISKADLPFVQNKKVISFAGFSASGYKDLAALVRHLTSILSIYQQEADNYIVNAGCSRQGIGVVYTLSRMVGIETMGLCVKRVESSSYCEYLDHAVIFDEKDNRRYGGPTTVCSQSLVNISDHCYFLGGGRSSMEELSMFRSSGKQYLFFEYERSPTVN
jgi:hypothetical protein